MINMINMTPNLKLMGLNTILFPNMINMTILKTMTLNLIMTIMMENFLKLVDLLITNTLKSVNK